MRKCVLNFRAWHRACNKTVTTEPGGQTTSLGRQQMDIKLAILFFIISAIIALSYLDDENIVRMKEQVVRLRRRDFRLRRSKV